MRRSVGILLVAAVHFACSYILFFVSLGIGMKSFDSPHVLTFSEKIWTSVARIMFLPLAAPLQRSTKDLIAPIVTDAKYGAGVNSLAAAVWLFGPLVLNSVLWAALIWWAYSVLTRRFGLVSRQADK